jgi:sugar lactone lactonase YvrE
MLELILLAGLSGDPKLCPQHAQRLEAIATALEQRPTDATLHYWEAATWADCRQVAPALVALDLVREHGEGFLPIRGLGFEAIWDDSKFQKRRVAFENALPRVGVDAPMAFRATGKLLIPEGVAYDRTTQSLFLGSTVQGQIIRLRAGRQEPFATPSAQLDSVLGLTVAVETRRLYAVSTNQVFPRKDDDARNRVLVFDIDKGTLVRTLAANAGQLNDIAISNSDIYVTDSRTGAVYFAGPEDSTLKELLAPGTVFGANGIARGPGDSLFVAHATGVAKVDVRTRAVARLTNTTRETIAAIDGLYFHRGSLLGVQNATNPGRVIQMKLDADSTDVVEVKTLLSHHHPSLDEPTTGALDGERLLVLANSHIGAADENGQVREDAATRDPVILEIRLPP